jgi:hypothetical protein
MIAPPFFGMPTGLRTSVPHYISHGLSKTPGSKTADISPLTTSREFRPSPTPDPTDAISIAGGTYQLKTAGVWGDLTADAGTWGTATAVRIACASSGVHNVPESAVLTVGAVDYTFTVTTPGYAPGYGVEYDVNNSNPDVTRIGDLTLHQTLPVQSQMYSCLLLDNGTENYKLDPADWSRKLDGTASNLDGTDGQVVIWQPGYWYRVWRVGGIKREAMSHVSLPGYTYNRPQYISAYEASLHRPTLKLSSVKNLSADYRGGNNNAAWDAESRTLLGKPATSISRTNFRTYARNRGAGWEMDNYFAQRTLLRFSLCEFATRDSQKAVNAALIDGLRQGGLGIGVTNINGTLWGTFNGYNPFIACGQSDSLGNATGDVVYAMPAEYGVLDTYVNRYRGVELPFGHVWKNMDGINVRIYADTETTPVSEAFITDDPSKWNDSNYIDYTKIGEVPRASGYIRDMIDGELMPSNITGAASTTYWCDYEYTSLPASGENLRTVLLGGYAYYGSNAGLGFSNSNRSTSYASSTLGSRLCYIPA